MRVSVARLVAALSDAGVVDPGRVAQELGRRCAGMRVPTEAAVERTVTAAERSELARCVGSAEELEDAAGISRRHARRLKGV